MRERERESLSSQYHLFLCEPGMCNVLIVGITFSIRGSDDFILPTVL